MTKLTRGWLINRIENPMDFNNSDEAIEAFKIALAGMDSEPVAFVKSGYALCYFRPPQEYGLKIGDKLYAAPPAPLAVDEVAEQAGVDPAIADAYMQGYHDSEARKPAPVAVPTFEEWCQRAEQKPVGWVREAMKEAYDACRAAMLKGES